MTSLTNNIKAVLALIVAVSSLAYFYMCSIREIKPDPQILIAMVSIVTMVLGYYFGSSSKADKPDATVTKADTVNVDQSGGASQQ
jgi:hypothetical protein